MTRLSADLPEPSGIDSTVEIDARTISGFQSNGHAVVRGLASGDEIAAFRPTLEALVARMTSRAPPIADRDTYGKAFLQAHNLWTRDEAARRFVFSARFAKAAADLMQVSGVRLYHDQALFKEPGGGHTLASGPDLLAAGHQRHHYHVDATGRRAGRCGHHDLRQRQPDPRRPGPLHHR